MPCLCEQVTPACPLPPASPELWINLDPSMEPTISLVVWPQRAPGAFPSHQRWNGTLRPLAPAVPLAKLALPCPCIPTSTGWATGLLSSLHPARLHSQEAGTKTTCPLSACLHAGPGQNWLSAHL